MKEEISPCLAFINNKSEVSRFKEVLVRHPQAKIMHENTVINDKLVKGRCFHRRNHHWRIL